MKLPERFSSYVLWRTAGWRHVRLLGVLISGVASAIAQSVIAPAPAPEPPATPPGAITPAPPVGEPSTAPFQWGDFGFRPHIFYRYSYGDGLQRLPGVQTKTSVNIISPGMLVDIGTHWSLDYTPTWTFYSNGLFSNSVGHTADLTGAGAFTDGSVTFAQHYDKSNNPLIETGRQTRQETATTSLSVNYGLTLKTRLEIGLSQDLRYVSASPNSYVWSTQDWIHYQFTDRVDTAVGFGVGYDEVQPGTDMTFTSPQARIGWRPTDKLIFDVHGGAEQRHFRRSGEGTLNTPIYGVSATYRPVDVTTLSLTGERAVSASYFTNQVTQNTSWGVNLDQRLLQVLHLSAGVRRSTSHYVASAAGVLAGRDDVSNSYLLRLGTSFLRRGTIGIVYQRIRNSSNSATYSFTSNETGLEIGYRF